MWIPVRVAPPISGSSKILHGFKSVENPKQQEPRCTGLASNRLAQRNAIAHAPDLTIDIVAAVGIINPVAVAYVEPVLGAVPPDRVLHEPREGLRESRVELAGINSHGDRLDNVGATTGPVAARPVRVVGIEPTQNACANQKIVDQRIYGDHA